MNGPPPSIGGNMWRSWELETDGEPEPEETTGGNMWRSWELETDGEPEPEETTGDDGGEL